jgi:hypothetical protein
MQPACVTSRSVDHMDIQHKRLAPLIARSPSSINSKLGHLKLGC